MYKTNPYYFNPPMYNNICRTCEIFSCPYCTNSQIITPQLANCTNGGNGNIVNFISILDRNGFIVQEGKLKYIDILQLCSEGIVDNCMGNNVGAPYAVCLLPPAPNQNPSKGQKPPIGYTPDNPNNYPYLVPGFTFKLRPDEAIVLIGETPPHVLYYCFRSYLGFIENKLEKNYSEYIKAGNDYTGFYHLVFASLGDQLNNYNIWTDNTPNGIPGEPYNSSSIIISTADKNINKQIRNALGIAGYSSDIMNDDNIPIELVNMGLEAGKDTFIYMMRFALWADQNAGNQYISNIDKFIKVLRITPKVPHNNLNPWEVPTLKIRETGITEYQVVPNSRNDLDYLRNQIINKYGGTEYNHVDLDLTVAIPDNFNAILRDVNVYGDDRDGVYFKTEDFQLSSDDDFVIVYGINHERTGKAIYSNASFYGAELFNGVAGAFSTVQFPDTALEFFPTGYENAGYYYVYKMARKADEENVVIIPYSTGNPLGKAYGVDNNQDARILFRVYLDKIAMVGPYIFDIIWDQAILFKKSNIL
ncbi:hypothetical protein SAMN02745134_00115 [Clostridium acidisoli DSM 12555]|uniref:Uncharacterized protein n=1 Tax=Clostridium acidisoli DSM 12555 TaxID=1121291 RepID=A0A1W1WXZ8_9CLOT|nr:hypothetical protein [Clostridium acidisoli]SMC16592.1 hypothetical protein SAMN02745134_00115 [Clostridium acidisoli DSM 12555]